MERNQLNISLLSSLHFKNFCFNSQVLQWSEFGLVYDVGLGQPQEPGKTILEVLEIQTEVYLLAVLMGILQNHRCDPDFYPFEGFCFWTTLPVWYLILGAITILTELNLSILEMNLEMLRNSFSAQPLPKKKTKQEKTRTDSHSAYHRVWNMCLWRGKGILCNFKREKLLRKKLKLG